MRSFALVALVGFAAATPMAEMEYKFINFVAQHGKSYATVEEYQMRMSLFAEREAAIAEINASQNSSFHAHNKFSDYTSYEMKNMMGYKPVVATETAEQTSNAVPSFDTGVNWVTGGAVTPVKDQGQCGSCWTFSSTGALEGAWFINNAELLSFSESQLVDCVKTCFGCNGGNQTLAFRYYKSHFPMLESAYPYHAVQGSCNYNENDSQKQIQVTGAVQVPTNSVSGLQNALAVQPIAVSIEADTFVFQTYTSGVLNSTACGTSLDHAVLAAGYGTENGQDYWLVKNSWGSGWGDNGYIKLAAVDGEGICGVQMAPVYPSL